MNGLFSLLLHLTLGGGAAVLILLAVRPAAKSFSARWRRMSAAAALLFFLIPFQLPAPAEPEPASFGPEALPAAASGADPEYIGAESIEPGPQGQLEKNVRGAMLILWLSGSAVLALYHAVNWRRFLSAVLAGSRRPPGETQELCRSLCAELGIRRPPELLCCGGVGAPMLAGAFRPRLLLPDALPEREKLALVLRHELTHLKSRDTLLKLAALGVSILHWWNPLAHVPSRLLKTDCELACDERVVLPLDAAQRRLYGAAILELMSSARTPLTAPFSRGHRLRRRLEAMLRAKPRSASVRFAGGAAALALAACGVLTSSLLARALPMPEENGGTFSGVSHETEVPRPDTGEACRRLADRLLSSVCLSDGEVRFTVPAEPPPAGTAWNIHIAGRSPGGLSLHWLEQESESGLWTPGAVYRFPLDPADYIGDSGGMDSGTAEELCEITAALIRRDGQTLETLTEGSAYPVLDWAARQVRRTVPSGTNPQTLQAAAPDAASGESGGASAPGGEALLLSLPLEDAREVPSYSGHMGLDYTAPAGKSVLAAAGGTAAAIQQTAEGGRALIVRHAGGLETVYALCGNFTVQPGDPVERGQKLAEIDRSGNWTPHLHFEVRRGGQAVDPAPYMNSTREKL